MALTLLQEQQQRARLRTLRVIVEQTGAIRFEKPVYCERSLLDKPQPETRYVRAA